MNIIETVTHPLASWIPPAWASEWGQDRYGVFVGFTIGAVTQRMRFISPGEFMMGASPEEVDSGLSPDRELTASRRADEGLLARRHGLHAGALGGGDGREPES